MLTPTNYRKYLTFTPAIDTNAYAAGDQIGPGSTLLSAPVVGPNSLTMLQAVHLIDAAKQKAAIDLLFWNSAPTIASSDNNAFDITDAEAAARFVGYVSIAAGNYIDTSSNSLATVKGIALPVYGTKNGENPSGRNLWVSLVSRGTPTYGSASALKFILVFE